MTIAAHSEDTETLGARILKYIGWLGGFYSKNAVSTVSYTKADTYLLLAECEVRTTSYGPSFFLPFMTQTRSARAMRTRKEKMRIHNLLYGPNK